MSTETFEIPVPASGLPNLRVAVLGAGKMGGILLQAFLKNNLLQPEQLLATVQHPEEPTTWPQRSRPTSSCWA